MVHFRETIEKEMEHAESHLKYFEEKYGMNFEDFEAGTVAGTEDPGVHEDYNAWFCWRELLARQRETISKYRTTRGSNS